MTTAQAAKVKVGDKLVYQKKYWSNSANEFFNPEIRTVRSVGKAFVMFDDGTKILIKHWTGPASAKDIEKAQDRIKFIADWTLAQEDNYLFDLAKSRENYKLTGSIEIDLTAAVTVFASDKEIILTDMPPEISRVIENLAFEKSDCPIKTVFRINSFKFWLKSYGGNSHTFERAK
jgi:hypothetical protein